MIKREWLLGAGLLSGSMLSATMLDSMIRPSAAQADDLKIGAVGAVNTAATGQLQGGASQTLFVGAGVFQNQTVRTDAGGLAEIMFTDQSTITVGHGSEVILDTFVYDPNNQVGQLAVSLSQGTMRFIGGKISKTTPVKITAPTSTLTIRGGIGLASFLRGQDGLVAFLYGIEMTVAGGHNGVIRSIRQPGFGVIVPADGSDPSEPFRLTDEQLAGLRQQLESNQNDQGQVPVDPLRPVKNFGSNDTFKPDAPLLDSDVGNNSILNGTGTGVLIDTTRRT
jgi:hypothetical protein